jgi:hypothetical protein
VPTEGLEPPHLAAHGPEPCASTNSATWAYQTTDTTCGYGSFWCPRRDSNPHTLRHMDLNHARLPIPPRGHTTTLRQDRLWCPRRDSNPHTLRHMDLNHARLPIPPRGPGLAIIARRCRRIPLRYQALPFCARPTFVAAAAAPFAALRIRLCRLRRERKYSGWIANVKAQHGCPRTRLHACKLGESTGPPLHYACQGVNPTNIARAHTGAINSTIRKRFEATNSYHSKPRGNPRRLSAMPRGARCGARGTRPASQSRKPRACCRAA